MDLYIQPAELFEKFAAEVALPEDANMWPNEILQELYKQVPYIADFDAQVVMDKVDAERGYGFGHVEVQNKTEVPQSLSPDAMRQVGVNRIRIPVIIKDRKLMPFDVLVTSDSKALPLTENRLRQALFRPQAFDVTGRTPGDMSLVGQLYPPYRQNYGFGGGGVVHQFGMGKEGSIGDMPTQEQFHEKLERVLGLTPEEASKLKNQKKQNKQASSSGVPNAQASLPTTNTIRRMTPNLSKQVKTGSILEAILPTIEMKDYLDFTNRFDHGLQASYMKNAHATVGAMRTLLSYEPSEKEWEKTSSVLDNLQPSVVQLRKEPSGYSVKQANHRAWNPVFEEIDRGEAVRRFGEKVVLAADLSGSVTLTDVDGAVASPEENRAEVVSGFGYYTVRTTDGQDLLGFVFPNLYDVDGSPIPISLFTDGIHSTVQDAIVGERRTEDIPDLPLEEAPKGHGCFVRVLDGSAEATIPLTVKAGYADPDGQKYQVETYDGRELMLSIQPNLKFPKIVDGTCIIPDDFVWLPLGNKQNIELVSDLESWGEKKEASQEILTVTVRPSNDNTFSLDGYPLRKLANEDRSFISFDDALFYFGGLGTNLNYVSEKLAESIAKQAPVKVKVGRAITTMKEALDGAVAAYNEKLAAVSNIRRDLVKEAAFLPDPIAVDTVLSLGFINPENINTFISFLPQIERVQSNLCELLIASRLGLQDIPTSALEKTVKSLEETIDGLKTVAFTKS